MSPIKNLRQRVKYLEDEVKTLINQHEIIREELRIEQQIFHMQLNSLKEVVEGGPFGAGLEKLIAILQEKFNILCEYFNVELKRCPRRSPPPNYEVVTKEENN